MPIVGTTSDLAISDFMEEARRFVLGGLTERLNVLGGTVTLAADKTVTSVPLADESGGVAPGSILEIDRELMYVRAYNETSKTATVIRAQGRSPLQPHDVGATVRVNPAFPTDDIFWAVVDEVHALNGTALVDYETVEFTAFGGDETYQLGLDPGTEPAYVYSAYSDLGSHSRTYDRWAPVHIELLRGMNTNDYPGGYALKVVGDLAHSATVRVTLGCRFRPPTASGNKLSELGIPPIVGAVLPVGAAWRLLLGKEARRLNVEHSSGSRRAEEVQPGSIAFLGRSLQRMREDFLEQALEHQFAKYPPRRELQ